MAMGCCGSIRRVTVGCVDAAAAAAGIAEELRAGADPQRAELHRRYLKSSIEHWGRSVPDVRSAVRRAGVARWPRDELLELVAALWAYEVFEPRLAAAVILDGRANVLASRDLPELESLVRQAGTWALVDVLVPRPLAAIDAEDCDATTAVLDEWARDADFWLRRSALLAHLVPLRSGELGRTWDRFSRYADSLLEDREFFVRKAIGWVLRQTAWQHPDLVAQWVALRTERISGVAIREAVKPLAAADREALLAAYRSR